LAAPPLANVSGDLDEIPIRVSKIDREDGTRRPGPLNGALLDRYPNALQMSYHVFNGAFGDKADIDRARRRGLCLRLELLPVFVEIKFLPPNATARRFSPKVATSMPNTRE
jgi:hypothetical protein